ncbi:MAG TPA: hypothetical protein VGV36_03765 [Solirubrobacteraceae bacterium]|nr:hypothetical protein [Solirubrobacteraceae bacterium]
MSEPVTLAPESVSAIAHAVAELLRDEPTTTGERLLTAAQVAALLGVARATVYEHADELGAQRLGDGVRGRLRFDRDTALSAWARRPTPPAPEPERTTTRRRTTAARADLLPIRGRDTA